MTPEEIIEGAKKRLVAFPEMQAIVTKPDFKATVADILEFAGLSTEYANVLELHIILLLTFYVPYSEFNETLKENLNIDVETADIISGLIDSLLLSDVSEYLMAYEIFNNAPEDNTDNEEEKETHMMPGATHKPSAASPQGITPITRDDIMRALQSQRTMPSDIENMKNSGE